MTKDGSDQLSKIDPKLIIVSLKDLDHALLAELKPDPMKVIVLGKSGTGKTCITNRYAHDRFVEFANSTIGAAFCSRRIEVTGKAVVMGIWDTAGSERYEAMSRIYYRGARAAIICYDLVEKSSFLRTKFWVDELKKNEPSCRIYLCGTKKDLVDGSQKRGIDPEEVKRYADVLRAPIFETSSKTGENINELFLRIALDFVADTRNSHQKTSRDIISLDSVAAKQPSKAGASSSPQKSKCCL